jgi:Family of unknown function (DUF6279)
MHFYRFARYWVVAVAAATIIGCASVPRLAYNNAPTFATWTVDDYFDLRDGQRDWVRERIGRLHAWHRKSELPEIRAVLNDMHDRVGASPWNESNVEQIYRRARASYERTVSEALPDMADFLLGLTPEQVVALEKKLAADNKKVARDVAKPTRNAERGKRFADRIEDFTGSLSSAQRADIETTVASWPSIDAAWVADRKMRQAEMLKLMRTPLTKEQMVAGLKRLMLQQSTWRDPAYLAVIAQREQATIKMMTRLMNQITPEQQAALRKRLKSYEGDVIALIAS